VTPSSAGPADEPIPLRSTVGLFLLVFAFYALTGPGHLSSIDGSVLLQSARNLLETGSGAVAEDGGENSAGITPRGVDGRFYPIWGPGLALAHVPTLFVVRHLELLRPVAAGRPVSARHRDEFYAPFTCAWLMSAAVVAIALSGCALGFPFRDSALLAALMAIGSPLWHYARFDTNEPLQCAGLIGGAYCLLRVRAGAGHRYAFLAGTLLSAAVAAKAQNVIVLPWFVLYAAAVAPRSRGRALLAMAVPLLITGAALGAVNFARYGSPFETGYHLTSAWLFDHPLVDGAFVLLFSLGFGLLVFFPAAALLPIAAPGFVRRFPAEAALIAAVFLSHLVIASRFYAYWGCAWGPRFLVPTVPLLGLVLLPLLGERGWRKRLLIATWLAGVGIQSLTVPTAFWAQVMAVWGNLAVPGITTTDPRAAETQRVETLVHSPSVAPLRVSLWLLQNTSCREPTETPPSLTAPPWQAQFPWRDPGQARELADLTGLDFWAAPSCWRPQRFASVLPSNPRLAWLLVALASVGATLLGTVFRDPDRNRG
jgi:hypothetical protein